MSSAINACAKDQIWFMESNPHTTIGFHDPSRRKKSVRRRESEQRAHAPTAKDAIQSQCRCRGQTVWSSHACWHSRRHGNQYIFREAEFPPLDESSISFCARRCALVVQLWHRNPSGSVHVETRAQRRLGDPSRRAQTSGSRSRIVAHALAALFLASFVWCLVVST